MTTTAAAMNAIESQQICSSCEQAIRHGIGNLDHVPGLIRRIIHEELWRERKVETGEIVKLNSFRELITAKRFRGWNENPEKIEAIIRNDVEALALWREAMKPRQGERTDLVDNINDVPTEKGTSRAYTVARLQKQHPELFERVKAGELSANKAAIEAGFRKVKTPYEQLCSWWRRADIDERRQFVQEQRDTLATMFAGEAGIDD